MKHSTLALCIPAYNAAWCLPRLLTSAASQEIPFDEILVYNDCSTDNTREIAKQYGATVIEGDINRGCSIGKNRLAEAAQSEWIHFHDADDVLYPNFTRLAHQWIQLSDVPDVVLFDYEWRDNDTSELLSVRRFNGLALKKDPIAYAIIEQINPFCGLYRKDKLLALGGYDTDPLILYNEDVAFHCKLAIAGLTFDAEPEIAIVNYRVGNSMSAANQKKCIQAHYQVLKKVASLVGDRFGKEISFKLWKAAGVAASLKDTDTVKACLALAQQLTGRKPVGENTYFTLFATIHPVWAVLIREQLIRILKPHLRQLK